MKGCLVKKLVGGGVIDDTDVGLNGKPLFGHLLEMIKERANKISRPRPTRGKEGQRGEYGYTDRAEEYYQRGGLRR